MSLLTLDEAVLQKFIYRVDNDRSWWVHNVTGEEFARIVHLLPPDLTCGGWEEDCGHVFTSNTSSKWTRWYCTRKFVHRGRHAAGDGAVILAVW